MSHQLPRVSRTYPKGIPGTYAPLFKGLLVRRSIACFIDQILLSAVTGLVVVTSLFTLAFMAPFIFVVLNLIYRAKYLHRDSATLGMRWMGIEFRHLDGAKLDRPTAWLHAVLIILAFGMVLPQVISLLTMVFGKHSRSVVDHILGTTAINTQALRGTHAAKTA